MLDILVHFKWADHPQSCARPVREQHAMSVIITHQSCI